MKYLDFRISVRVTPNSSHRNTVWKGEFLKVNLTSPPEDGRANEELMDLLATEFDIDPDEVILEHGEASRCKELTLRGLDRETLVRKISKLKE